MKDLHEIAANARNGFYQISVSESDKRNAVLKSLARLLTENKDSIFAANQADRLSPSPCEIYFEIGTNTSYSPLCARTTPDRERSMPRASPMILADLSILRKDLIANIKPPAYLCLKV